MITWIRPGDTPVMYENAEIAMRDYSQAAIAAGGFEAYAKLGGRLVGDRPESLIESSMADEPLAPAGAPARASARRPRLCFARRALKVFELPPG